MYGIVPALTNSETLICFVSEPDFRDCFLCGMCLPRPTSLADSPLLLLQMQKLKAMPLTVPTHSVTMTVCRWVLRDAKTARWLQGMFAQPRRQVHCMASLVLMAHVHVWHAQHIYYGMGRHCLKACF